MLASVFLPFDYDHKDFNPFQGAAAAAAGRGRPPPPSVGLGVWWLVGSG